MAFCTAGCPPTLAWTTVVMLVLAADASAHLRITEVGYDPLDETGATAEFVEILNPGPGSVPLADLWLANDEEAYPLLVHGPITSGITSGDFVYRFPAVTLAPGEVVVVCHDSDAFLAAYFPVGGLADFTALPGAQRLFEVTQDGAGDGVPDMIDYGSNPVGTLSMANNGECVGLASWDGISDRVVDLDWVCWLSLTYIPNKDVDYPLGIDGPDPGFDESWFLEDAGTAIAAPDAAEGSSIHRASMSEPGETEFGGNGVNGHDETTEDWSGWTIGVFSPGATAISTVGVPVSAAPASLRLALAGAHPTRGRVSVRYELPQPGHLRITVHDIAGRRLATLRDGPAGAGTHQADWDGRDTRGVAVPGGLCFIRLALGETVAGLRVARLP